MPTKSVVRKLRTVTTDGYGSVTLVRDLDAETHSYDWISSNGNFKNPLPYTRSHTHSVTITGSVSDINKTNPFQTLIVNGVTGYGVYEGGLSAQLKSELTNRAVIDALDQIRGNLDLTTDLFQARQVKSMMPSLYNSAARLQNVFVAIKKLKAKSAYRQASDMWLEYVYGWKPLASSVVDLMHEAVTSPKPWMTVTGRANARDKRSGTYTSGWTYTAYGLYGAKCVLHMRPVNDTIEQLSRISSLNPVSVAYELIPYSFVVDWFINIGGYIRGIETAMVHSDNFVSGYMSNSSRTEAYNELYIINNYSSNRVIITKGKGSTVRSNFQRSPLSALPFPRAPSTRALADLGSGQLINAAALLRTMIPR